LSLYTTTISGTYLPTNSQSYNTYESAAEVLPLTVSPLSSFTSRK
jgi:hypothetical protein